jgi:hypothetical protein
MFARFSGRFWFLLDALSGFRSLELSFLGLRCLVVTRTWALALRIVFLGPAVPSNYSRPGFGPSNCLFWACGALQLLELGLWPFESSSSGQQCRQTIRDRALVPRIVFFGPAVPPSCSRLGFGPSNCILRASSAFELFKIFESELRSFESSLSSRQCFYTIRIWMSEPSKCIRLHSVRVWADAFSNLSFGLSMLLNQHARILVAIYQFGCRMSNTKVSPRFATPDGLVFVSNALCR